MCRTGVLISRCLLCTHVRSCLTCGTIGGALGHRGIGIMSSKYGKIDDMCISMEVVLPNGDIINTLPVPKHAAGPDLNEIFIGSEGTLGVITKATFKLFEQPESRQHRAFLFPDAQSAPEPKLEQIICLPQTYTDPPVYNKLHLRNNQKTLDA